MNTEHTETSAQALIVIDVQEGFDDAYWGPSANPDCEGNIARLIDHWHAARRGPVIVVRHDSTNPASPLAAGTPGNRVKSLVWDRPHDLLITKTVNSALLGEPRLDDWLRAKGISTMVCCGIQTNMCVETTARMGGNLGFQVTVPIDATRTFDLTNPSTGDKMTAAELMRTTALNLQGGGFATITSTDRLLGEH